MSIVLRILMIIMLIVLTVLALCVDIFFLIISFGWYNPEGGATSIILEAIFNPKNHKDKKE